MSSVYFSTKKSLYLISAVRFSRLVKALGYINGVVPVWENQISKVNGGLWKML